MIGAIIGDIIGSAYEFHNISTKDFPLFSRRSCFTDDTVMTCAVAKVLLDCKGDYSALTPEAAAKTTPVPMEMVGTDDRFGQVGTEAFLRAEYRLTAEHIAEAAKKAIERK